jgi:hypothetical protein
MRTIAVTGTLIYSRYIYVVFFFLLSVAFTFIYSNKVIVNGINRPTFYMSQECVIYCNIVGRRQYEDENRLAHETGRHI